ncbi:MAG TPA: signal peptidase I [Thermoanaerobaculia bacterium]|nr:signal peptidase I [Thermoanaerobaculia bacterium]
MATPTRSVFREYFEALIVAGLFLGFTNTFAVKTFYIPSGSMEDSLLIGDHLFVNRFIYGATPSRIGDLLLPTREVRRGDVVIFRSPETPRVDLVKRCVGLPGDRIEVVDKDLYVNGAKVDDAQYTSHRDPRVYPRRSRLTSQTIPRDNYGPLTVPEDSYFCMGDNRDHSHDSRFWGTVPGRYVKGRAFLIYWSYGGETSDGTWHGWGHRLRHLGNTMLGFVTKTRWNRTLHLVR